MGWSEPPSAEESPPLGAVLGFMSLMWRVDHALQQTSKRMESTLGVTGQQRLVIRIVGRFPRISAGRLARVLHVHPSTLTGLVKRLEGKGMVERRADPSDGRCTLLRLTRKGHLVDVASKGTVEAAIRRALKRTSPRARVVAGEVLSLIASTLDGLRAAPAPRAGARKS